jgi:hypothetical protein
MYQSAFAEGEISNSVTHKEILHLLQHRRLVQIHLMRATRTPVGEEQAEAEAPAPEAEQHGPSPRHPSISSSSFSPAYHRRRYE